MAQMLSTATTIQQMLMELQGPPSIVEADSTRITSPRQVQLSMEPLMFIQITHEGGVEVAATTTAIEAVVEEATEEAPI